MNTCLACLIYPASYVQSLRILNKDMWKHHVVILKFLIFGGMSHNLGTTWWKALFQAHIVEEHKSYKMVVESWKLVHVNLFVPLFAQGTW